MMFGYSERTYAPTTEIYTYKNVEEVSQWNMYDVEINDKYKATLAIRGKSLNLLHYDFFYN